jgi:diadenylate cyclase
VDARLSLELLTAIFAKTSPLHDGAVIVRDLTIEGAACFLPLSENTIAVGRHVGTRHRAAVGLSEQTDAVVVVVSEESGLVSVARAGRLSVPIDDEERLRRVLAACILPTRRTPKANKSLFANLLTRVPRAQSPSEQFRA